MAIENPDPSRKASSTDFNMRFPPFPQPPEGTVIIPFKDYKEVGILKETPDRVERDAQGIPTIAVKTVHATDRCKTNAQIDRKDTKISSSKASREWWHDWENMERRIQPGSCYDDRLPPQDRLHQAANDFIRARRPITQRVNHIWDQIQLYLGLLQNTPRQKTNPEPSKDDEDNDDFSDDEEEPQIEVLQASQNMDAQRTTLPRLELPSRVEEDPPQVDNDGLKTREPLNDASKERALDFFENPEKNVAIFLSSYMMTQGFHFDEYKLLDFPRVLGFFVKYLIINNVWPECKARLVRAQNTIGIASQELICTSKISKALPDDLNHAFRDHWKINPDVFYGDAVPDDDSDADKPEAKRRKVDLEVTVELEQSLKDANVDLIKPEDMDVLMEEAVVAEESGGWGSEGKWNVDDDATPAPQNPWVSPEQDWSFSASRPGLIALLGPTATALPITHTTGIVEQSMRRITDIIPPPKDAPALSHTKGPSPQAVEAELERRFTKVVLSPWLGTRTGNDEPTISSLSMGPVLGKDDVKADAPPSGRKPHNPWKDNITIFVGEDAAKELRKGMGLGGSWIQMARRQDFESEADRMKKKKGKKSDDRFWYMCSLMTVLTSYHLAPSEA